LATTGDLKLAVDRREDYQQFPPNEVIGLVANLGLAGRKLVTVVDGQSKSGNRYTDHYFKRPIEQT
jgi:hypothetical protein